MGLIAASVDFNRLAKFIILEVLRQGVAPTRCGSHKVWLPQGVAPTRCGSHKVWLPQGVAPTRCGSHKVWLPQGADYSLEVYDVTPTDILPGSSTPLGPRLLYGVGGLDVPQGDPMQVAKIIPPSNETMLQPQRHKAKQQINLTDSSRTYQLWCRHSSSPSQPSPLQPFPSQPSPSQLHHSQPSPSQLHHSQPSHSPIHHEYTSFGPSFRFKFNQLLGILKPGSAHVAPNATNLLFIPSVLSGPIGPPLTPSFQGSDEAHSMTAVFLGVIIVVVAALLAAIGVSVTINTRRLREKTAALEMLKERAEVAERNKGVFIANTAHELRTPIYGMEGMLKQLDEGGLDSGQRGDVGAAVEEAERILSLVNAVLDVCKADAGCLHLESLPFALRPWLRDVLHPHVHAAQGRGLKFESHVTLAQLDSLPPFCYVIRRHLQLQHPVPPLAQICNPIVSRPSYPLIQIPSLATTRPSVAHGLCAGCESFATETDSKISFALMIDLLQ
ncbi:unnamed protein product [Closterium sp. Yama58-4]|nr:unnamed protein product [Closterium sp. Yama58-4]